MTKENKDDEILVSPKDIADAINSYIALDPDKAPIFSPVATMRFAVLEAGGAYKNRMVDVDQEFQLKAVRPGQRNEFIIELTPLDARPYSQIEMEDNRVEALAPDVADFMAEALGYKGSDWKVAKAKFYSEKRRERAQEKAAAEAKAQQEAESFYKNDPLFGIFA